jgi:hypothetical protein
MIKTFTDIAEEIRELQTQLEAHAEENGGDITDFPLLQHLEDLQKAQQGKEAHEHMLCSLACMSLEYEDEAEAMKIQAARILEAAGKVSAKAEGIRKFVAGQIQPGTKIKDDRVTLSMRESSAVEIEKDTSPTDLPLEYQRVQVVADKNLLKAALKKGEQISGVSIVTRYNLQIK